MVQSSRGPKNSKLYETIAVSRLWSNCLFRVPSYCLANTNAASDGMRA